MVQGRRRRGRQCGVGIAFVPHGLAGALRRDGRHQVPRDRHRHDRGRTAAVVCQPEHRPDHRARAGRGVCAELSGAVRLCAAHIAQRWSRQPQRGHQSGLLQLYPILLLGAGTAVFGGQHGVLPPCCRFTAHYVVRGAAGRPARGIRRRSCTGTCADGAGRRCVDRVLLRLRRGGEPFQRMDGKPPLPLFPLWRILR